VGEGKGKDMKAILYANIGNRDLGRGRTSIYNSGDNIYEESKRLFDFSRGW